MSVNILKFCTILLSSIFLFQISSVLRRQTSQKIQPNNGVQDPPSTLLQWDRLSIAICFSPLSIISQCFSCCHSLTHINSVRHISVFKTNCCWYMLIFVNVLSFLPIALHFTFVYTIVSRAYLWKWIEYHIVFVCVSVVITSLRYRCDI